MYIDDNELEIPEYQLVNYENSQNTLSNKSDEELNEELNRNNVPPHKEKK